MNNYYYYASEATLQEINENLSQINTNVSDILYTFGIWFSVFVFIIVLCLVIRTVEKLLNSER